VPSAATAATTMPTSATTGESSGGPSPPTPTPNNGGKGKDKGKGKGKSNNDDDSGNNSRGRNTLTCPSFYNHWTGIISMLLGMCPPQQPMLPPQHAMHTAQVYYDTPSGTPFLPPFDASIALATRHGLYMVALDRCVGSTIIDQLFQHHGFDSPNGHRWGRRLHPPTTPLWMLVT
jgi:hypothetical protein